MQRRLNGFKEHWRARRPNSSNHKAAVEGVPVGTVEAEQPQVEADEIQVGLACVELVKASGLEAMQRRLSRVKEHWRARRPSSRLEVCHDANRLGVSHDANHVATMHENRCCCSA